MTEKWRPRDDGEMAAAVQSKVKNQTDKINKRLMNLAESSHDISSVASPVTAGGVTLNRFQLPIMKALQIV